MVDQYLPGVRRGLEKALRDRAPPPAAPAKPSTSKKHKPMGKNQQENSIALLEGKLQEIDRASPASPASREPVPQAAPEADSSGDESDSEEE